MLHTSSSEYRNKTLRIKSSSTHPQVPDFGGSSILIEDWWDRINGDGKSWRDCVGNPACLVYAVRSVFNNFPADDEVLYGHIDSFGHIVHISELEIE